MSHITGLFLIDAPASALNNLGTIPGERYENSTGVKVIRANGEEFPYVSAQAYRYWLRETAIAKVLGWKPAPMYREEKIAYTDANPIEYWDDDLFGYMRAPSTKAAAKAKREADGAIATSTETKDTVTRVAPFRVSTLVSIASVRPTNDFGTMSRMEGFPVIHEHQFYRTTLKGLFSLALGQCGTFSYKQKTGFRNLDDVRVDIAKAKALTENSEAKTYQLPFAERLTRITALFEAMMQIEGGAKQTLHYTDVSPALVVLAVTKGGNHLFNHVIGANSKGLPEFKTHALEETLRVFADSLLSPVYVGWVKGYVDEERAKLEAFAATETRVKISHPREAYQALINDLKQPGNAGWLD